MDKLIEAVGRLVKAKGRYHTEQNYKAVVEAYDEASAERAASNPASPAAAQKPMTIHCGNPSANITGRAASPAPVAASLHELPRWIDDRRGRDPETDALIEYIEKLRAALGATCWDNEPDSDSGPRDCARSIRAAKSATSPAADAEG